MKIERIPIDQVKENPENPRSITPRMFEKLVESIKKFPEMLEIRPIVLNKDGVPLGGNMRHRAAKAAGLTHIHIIRAENLTKKQQKEFIIKDNMGYGKWDWEIINADWNTDELEDWGLDVKFRNNEEGYDDNYKPRKDLKVDIKPGELWAIGNHRILCADATDEESYKHLCDQFRADCILTDPPYNVNYTGGAVQVRDGIKNDKLSDSDFYKFLLSAFKGMAAVVKAGGPWYVWHADIESINFKSAMIDAGIKVAQTLIWNKNKLNPGRHDYHYKHEPCLYGWKEGSKHRWYSDRKQTTVLEFARPNVSAEHPTMKPIPLIAYQINNSTKEGDLVLDPFLGSGTTMVAAHQLGRVCFGLELDPYYAQVTVDRMLSSFPDLIVKKIA